MKKNLFLLLSVFIFTAQAIAAPLFYWGSESAFTGGSGPDLLDHDDSPIPTTSKFTVQLLRLSDESLLYAADLSYWWSFAGKYGVGFNSIPENVVADTWNGLSVFTRIYNHEIPSSATHYADTPQYTITWDSGSTATPDPIEYNIGTISSVNWQVIPEPMTATMLAMCAALYGLKKLGRARKRG
jgi:hypothetical protein